MTDLATLDAQYGIGASAAPVPAQGGASDLASLDAQHGIGGAKPSSAKLSAQDRSLAAYGKQGIASDIALSILDALPKGAAQLFGSVGDLQELADKISTHIADKLGLPPEGPSSMSQHFGMRTAEPPRLPTSGDIRSGIESAAAQPLYEPQTTLGKFIGAGVQGAASMPFAPGAGALGGIGGEAGEAVGGTPGRMIGAAAGALIPAGARALLTSPGKTAAQANEIAGRDVLNQIGPATETPSEIAPRVQAAAEGTVSGTRQSINEAAKPLYDVSREVPILPGDWKRISEIPSFQEALKALRSDPELGAQVKDLPDNSVGVVDAVKKMLDERASQAVSAGSNNLAALRTAAAQSARDAATSASPEYAKALEIGRTGRQTVLGPLEQSPLGQLALSDDLKKQGQILFAENPAAGSEKQVADAVRTIAARDPEAARMLVRAKLEQTFNEVTQQIATGPNVKGGAQFAAKVAGNSQQAKNLRAALDALPNGEDASRAFANLLNIFREQGKESVAGPVSEFLNTGTLGKGLKLLSTPLRNAAGNVSNSTNISRLSQIMTDPDAIKQLRRLATLDPKSEGAKALFATLVNTGQQ